MSTGRGWWVIPADTVQWLRERLTYMPLDPEVIAEGRPKSFLHVTYRMDDVRLANRRLRNNVNFANMTTLDTRGYLTASFCGPTDTLGK